MDISNGTNQRNKGNLHSSSVSYTHLATDRGVLNPLSTNRFESSINNIMLEKVNNNTGGVSRPFQTLFDKNDGISSPASILKRLGKENENCNVNLIDANGSSQSNKRVRIVSPQRRSSHVSGMTKIAQAITLNEDRFDPDDDFEMTTVPKNGEKNQNRDNDFHHTNKRMNQDGNTLVNEEIQIADEDMEVMQEILKMDGFNDEPNETLKPDVRTRRNKKAFKHWLMVRYQPKVLSDAVSSLTINQKKWIKSTGFGSILSFRMNQYPQALSYQLALSFQNHTTSLCYGTTTIPLTDDDVNEVLGLPMGKQNIQIIKSDHIEYIWGEQFKPHAKKSSAVTAKMLCEAIKKSSEVDRMFKLNFLVLLNNILIEGPTSSYVVRTILGFTGDLDKCHRYNWCSYLINNLRTSYLAWIENPEAKYFTGSIPMLVYLYMDRVVNSKRRVRRKKPTFIGWSDSLILDRQIADVSADCFFQGKIALPLRYKDSDDESSYEDCTWNKKDYSSSDGEEVGCDNVKKQQHSYVVQNKNISIDAARNDLERDEASIVAKIKSDHHVEINEVQTITSSLKGKYSEVNETEIPRYVIDNLKLSIDDYENIQGKCIMYLLSARELFKNNRLVSSLEARFIDLIEKAGAFVKNELSNDCKKDEPRLVNWETDALMKETNSLVDRAENIVGGNKVYGNSKLSIDDNNHHTREDRMFFDSSSVPRNNSVISSRALFDNMESQSKSFFMSKQGSSSGFNTPGSGSVFRVPLDATVPNFNLGIDNLDVHNKMTKEQDQLSHITAKQDNGRPKRDIKLSDLQKSPFVDRFTSIYGKIYKKEETDMWNWLHSNKRYPNRVLFRCGNLTCYKVDFQSMKDGEMVMTSAVDVWSFFLNTQEELRSPNSPHRLFCYIETTLGSLTAFNDKTIDKTYKVFEENMDHVMRSFKTKLSDVDLVFFPIFQNNHYYVVCYNLKHPAVDILDNRNTNKPIKALYGNKVPFLHKHFTSYMVKKNHPKAREVSRIDPQRLVMQWQTKDNDTDCGVFAMRHMETYFGGGVRTWMSKFAPEGYTQTKMLSRLRLLFTYRMISCPLNELYGVVLDEIKDPTLLT